jgi:hypothetical protein
MPDDPAYNGSISFNYLGRACLSESFVASRDPATVEAANPPVAADHCNDVPEGSALFSANFDDDNALDGFTLADYYGDGPVPYGAEVVAGGVSGQALKITGGTGSLYDSSGVTVALDKLKPSYIEYSFKLSDLTSHAAVFALNYDPLEQLRVYHGTFYSEQESTRLSVTTNWVRVQLRNIDWATRTYDLYVDCQRVARQISFSYSDEDALVSLYLSNVDDDAVSFFDNILIK